MQLAITAPLHVQTAPLTSIATGSAGG
jgi:hypothetical protein